MQAVVLIVSFVILGVGLTKAFSSFFLSQKEELLLEKSRQVAETFKEVYLLNSFYNNNDITREIQVLEIYLDVSLLFLDKDNKIKFVSGDVDSSWCNKELKINEIPKRLNGEIYYRLQGDLEGIYNTKMLSIVYPVMINHEEYGTIITSIPITQILATIEESYQIIILFTVFAIVIAFILVYFFTKKITRPLAQINEVAKIMASGNFKKRTHIESKDEIGQLAGVLNEMAKNIDEQEQIRREFISNISHDIRSPLTSMRGFLQAIIDGTIPKDKTNKYLNIVLEETERLTRLANNILDINKFDNIENKQNEMKFDLNTLIRDTIGSFEARVLEKNIKITLTLAQNQTFVFYDAERIQRVIYNLVDNAIKFTEENKNVFISTSIKANKIFVSIKDEGCGINKNEQKKIFDRFYKTDLSRGKDKKGSGLGLSIVRDLILSIGENIEIYSDINKGCEFIFTLTKLD